MGCSEVGREGVEEMVDSMVRMEPMAATAEDWRVLEAAFSFEDRRERWTGAGGRRGEDEDGPATSLCRDADVDSIVVAVLVLL